MTLQCSFESKESLNEKCALLRPGVRQLQLARAVRVKPAPNGECPHE